MSAFSTETELAARVVQWLHSQGWTVYQEVAARGCVCDIVAVRGPVLWAIECKLQFGVKVLEQAMTWVGCANRVSVATPYARTNIVFQEFCSSHGIGWLTVPDDHVTGSPEHRFDYEPALRSRIANNLRSRLREEQKTLCPAGSQGGHYTPFRETCRRVADFVGRFPGTSLKALIDGIQTHYRSPATARASIAHWAEHGKIPGVSVRRDGKKIQLFPDHDAIGTEGIRNAS